MNSAAPAVSLRGVGKVYRLYQKPSYRVMDLLGICPSGSAYYTEHSALRNVSLDIGRGEKVAIIGRNGAGKTTLLKIITETVRPTTGTVVFNGRVSPLLQIGVGFHGDFTGRQNVYASLAHMGVTGNDAHRRFEQIVDFAELEEYIEQPMKTYSTGMTARLMFSTATAIDPEILVVDELLGVGDAYFAHKSFERMRQMCAEAGTTLLLVTHDIYSALNLCDRFIWIDRGEVLMDGDGRSTVAAYEQSIKEQEEQRVRARNRLADGVEATALYTVQVRSRSGFALPEPLALSAVELLQAGGARAALDVAEGDPAWTLQPNGNLGAPAVIEGVRARAITPYGSIYHKAEWSVRAGAEPVALRVRWLYRGTEPADIVVIGAANKVIARQELKAGQDWQHETFRVDAAAAPERPGASGHYGTGRIRITKVMFFDETGQDTVRVRHGAPMGVRVDFTVPGDPPPAEPTFVLAFHRPGVAAAAYVHTDRLALPPARSLSAHVRMPTVLLGSGTWLVTAGFAETDFYHRPFHPYFTVNEQWHHVIARGFELHVDSSSPIDAAAFFVQPATIEVHPAAPSIAEIEG